MTDINKASLDPQQLLDDKVRRSGGVRAAALLHAACDAAGWLCWQLPRVLQPASCRFLFRLSVYQRHRLDRGRVLPWGYDGVAVNSRMSLTS